MTRRLVSLVTARSNVWTKNLSSEAYLVFRIKFADYSLLEYLLYSLLPLGAVEDIGTLSMRLRLRTPAGQFAITLADDATIDDLVAEITSQTLVHRFEIKYGYPPKRLHFEHIDVTAPLKHLEITLNNETLIISPKDDTLAERRLITTREERAPGISKASGTDDSFSFSKLPGVSASEQSTGPISLKRKTTEGEVPEIALPDRGATMVLRVMPDDNSCLFRAFGTAVIPGDDLSMPELRSLVASSIQADSQTYSEVVLEQKPDDYCRWIQTADAWGGAIELGILSNHFDIEICSIDVQSLRIDRFNEGRSTRCILVYSGIHYDTIVQSPSEFPHTEADTPPEFDKRIWDTDDDEILIKALDLCRKLQEKHYYTDTGGMAIKCNECGIVVYGQGQAAGHAQQTGHYDMGEVPT